VSLCLGQTLSEAARGMVSTAAAATSCASHFMVFLLGRVLVRLVWDNDLGAVGPRVALPGPQLSANRDVISPGITR